MDKVEKFKELFFDLETTVNKFVNEYIGNNLSVEKDVEYRKKIQSKGQELIKMYEEAINEQETKSL